MLRELNIYGALSVSPTVFPQHINYLNGYNNPGRNVFSYFIEEELETQVVN